MVHITHKEREGISFSLLGVRNTWQKLFLRYLSLTRGTIISCYSGRSPGLEGNKSKSIFSFPPMSRIRPFQRSWSGRPGWGEGGRKRERRREMDKERRNRKGREEERNSPVAAFSQPTGLVPVATGFWKKKSSSANHLHLDLLSAPVTHPVSVTNSNKHPNLITQLPLNPAVSEENQKKKKSSPTEQLWGFFSFFSSVPSFMVNCYEAHVCSYAKLSNVSVRFTSCVVTVPWGRAARLVVSLLGFSYSVFYTVVQYAALLILTAAFGCPHATRLT